MSRSKRLTQTRGWRPAQMVLHGLAVAGAVRESLSQDKRMVSTPICVTPADCAVSGEIEAEDGDFVPGDEPESEASDYEDHETTRPKKKTKTAQKRKSSEPSSKAKWNDARVHVLLEVPDPLVRRALVRARW